MYQQVVRQLPKVGTPCTLGWYGKYHCLVQDIPKGSTNLVHISY
ncbi:hypothetical protein BACSTE_02090 [Bacteroides stercoris ATCC 43183]|uniref:Uncharacterized protein n=1 Tax=Bacteroides stercoris ATCC 43183 TaxID=449673 RepID=B0NRI1_BACSE|nr:hypothetical protein BACSTE_02090 [Bacteroides stercoris ATCC 43183]